jgi:hypothetical protein
VQQRTHSFASTSSTSQFQALLAEKAKEKAKREAVIAQRRQVEEERLREEKAAKIKVSEHLVPSA